MDGTASLSKADSAQTMANEATINISDLDLFINGGYATEVTSPYDNLICDKGGFYDQVEGVYGTYTFTYNGSAWTLNGSTVELANYGIVLGETPSANDTITVVLTEVIGSMSDINSQMEDLSDSIANTATAAASALESAQDDLHAAINAQAERIASAQTAIDLVTTKTAGMGFTNQYGLVLYGQNATDSEGFKLQLAAQAINFINGALGASSDILAYISGNALNINNAIIRSQLKFGNFAFIPRSNGNMCLKYLG